MTPTLLSHSPYATTGIRRRSVAAPPPARSSRARRLLLQPPRTRTDDTAGGVGANAEALLLRSGLRPESLPRHVAMVMDGNSRWARARGLTPVDGHKAGARSLERVIWLSHAWGIRALTAFVCSHENLNRPKAEILHLMGLCAWLIGVNVDKLSRQGIRLQVIGDASKMPGSLHRAAAEADEATRHNSRLHVMLAICYSGRWDMVQACRELARAARAGELSPDDIDEPLLAGRVATSAAGELDRLPGSGRQDQRRAASQQLPALAVGLLGVLLHRQDVARLWGGRVPLEALSSYQSRDRRFGQRA